jgi:twitching motility protein PilT
MIETIKKLVQSNPGISDFHLRAGHNFAYRESGEIIVLENTKISPSDLEALLSQSCTDKQRQEFSSNFELDCAIELEAVRLRANFYKSSDQICAVLRKIESKPPLMEDLNLPPVLHNVIDAEQGLVLITGPTGSGKTTTLASIIGEINRQRSCNIITIEDPIEFIHPDIKSIISQREIGRDTKKFSAALRAALREDPDVILVGEMRDLETIGLALTAAETGHLVFGTLHTNGAPSTISRIIDAFPSEQQSQVRTQLSDALAMVVTQNLFRKKDDNGRVGAFEVLVSTPGVRNLIRENKVHQLYSVMQTSQQEGMITLDKSIENLIIKGLINPITK